MSFKNKFTEEPILSPWLSFQERCMQMYNRWCNYWIKLAEETKKPIYFFRFEDILQDPKRELTNIFKFILGMDSIEGTVIERRIEDVIKMGAKAN